MRKQPVEVQLTPLMKDNNVSLFLFFFFHVLNKIFLPLFLKLFTINVDIFNAYKKQPLPIQIIFP